MMKVSRKLRSWLAGLDWVPALFLFVTPVLAVSLTVLYLYLYEFNWWLAVLFVVFYALTAMSITGGYHRLFAHKSYEASFLLRLFYALFGAAAFQNSILKWATDHRLHHRYVDGEEDPYSISKGFWYAHIGWMLTEQKPHPMQKAYSRDLRQDPIVMWQDRHYLPIAITMGFFLPTLLGWLLAGSALGGLAIAGFLRMVALHHGTFFINSWCHVWGRQTYTDTNSAKDSHIMAFFTFGEGYHNFHHIFDADYRNGVRWYHWDPTKWAIKFQAILGLAQNLKKTPEEVILKAKMEMVEKRIHSKVAISGLRPNWQEKLDDIKEQVRQTQAKWKQMQLEYRCLKRQKVQARREQLIQLRAELKLAKVEFSMALAQWRAYTATLLRHLPESA